MVMSISMVCFLLLVAHAACDYIWQTDAIAVHKNPFVVGPLHQHVNWYYWMAAHALMHGGAVALITGSAILGIAESIMHFIIDVMKCAKIFTIHADQISHLLCKVLWIALWLKFFR